MWKQDVRQGEVWWARDRRVVLLPEVGRKDKSERPVLIISGNNWNNDLSRPVLVIPLSSNKEYVHKAPDFEAFTTSTREASRVIVPMVQPMLRDDLIRKMTNVSKKELVATFLMVLELLGGSELDAILAGNL